jgi:hypothetical protein
MMMAAELSSTAGTVASSASRRANGPAKIDERVSERSNTDVVTIASSGRRAGQGTGGDH